MNAAMELARSCAEGGPGALAVTKDLLKRFSWQAWSVEEGAKASAAPRLGAECRDGLAAFFGKRPAPWAPPADGE
jgi:methylglutaconyl-CoA hydratase